MAQLNQIVAVTSNTDTSKHHSMQNVEPATGVDSFANTLRQQLQMKKPQSKATESNLNNQSASDANLDKATKSVPPANTGSTPTSSSKANVNSNRAAEKTSGQRSTEQAQDKDEVADQDKTAADMQAMVLSDSPVMNTGDVKSDTVQLDTDSSDTPAQPQDNSALMTVMPLSPWMQTMMSISADHSAQSAATSISMRESASGATSSSAASSTLTLEMELMYTDDKHNGNKIANVDLEY